MKSIKSIKTQINGFEQKVTLRKVQHALVVVMMLLFQSCNTDSGKNETKDAPVFTGKETYTDSGSSSVRVYDENGRVCIQQNNTYYEMTTAIDGPEKIPLLLKIKKTELCFADSVNKHKVYEVEAKSLGIAKDIHWETQFMATDMQFADNTLLAIHEGVEEVEDYYKRFNLLTGEEIFQCSYGDLKIAIPNVRGKFFAGFTSRRAASQPLEQLQVENLLGVFTYSTGKKKISIIQVKLKRSALAGKIQSSTPDMVWEPVAGATTAIDNGKTIILMKADERYTDADVKDFSVRMTFYYGDDNEFTEIIIPVENNRPAPARARYDKDVFELTETNP